MPSLTTDRQIAALKPGTKPVKHALGDKLYIRVTPDGRKYWYFRYKMPADIHQREYGLGHYPALSLSDARQMAREWTAKVAQGISPIATRREQRAAAVAETAPIIRKKTFQQCAEECHRDIRDGWKHPVHVHQWLRSLETYAYPIIGALPIDAITTDHVMQVLQPIWATKADTASKVRQRIERVLIWAKARKLRSGENPAAWKENIEPLVMPVAAAKQNIRDRDGDDKNYLSLPYSDMPEFMRTLHEPRFQDLSSAAALEFLIMTATRRANTVAVEWEHIDFAKQVWTIPAEQMKSRKGMGVELRVPLCDTVIALLCNQQMKQHNNPSRYVFPGAFDITRPIHGETLWQLLGHMGYRERATVHGFRATFRTWGAEETDAPFDVLERALAHTTGNAVVNAYDRGDRFERRRQVMNAWARFVLGEDLPKVIEFPRRSTS